MLELRPNCEWCDVDLPADSDQAMICSYECTYCATCVESVLKNVCATCGGGFVHRPIRPRRNHRDGKQLGLANQPASTQRVTSQWTREQVDEQADRLASVAPGDR